jgi:hypothetical protein
MTNIRAGPGDDIGSDTINNSSHVSQFILFNFDIDNKCQLPAARSDWFRMASLEHAALATEVVICHSEQ